MDTKKENLNKMLKNLITENIKLSISNKHKDIQIKKLKKERGIKNAK